MKPLFRFFRVLGLLGTLGSSFCASADDSALIPGSEIRIRVLFWSADCLKNSTDDSPQCSAPKAIEGMDPQILTLPIVAVFKAGQSAFSRTQFKVNGINLMFSTYSVAPETPSPFPPYIQIQVEILDPVQSICMQSVRWKVPFEMPSLVCASYQQQEPLKKWGISITQMP